MTERPFDLTGRTVLITGASSGLGARFARRAAECGAKVALAARRLDRLEAVRAEIVAEGGTALAMAMDVTRQDQVIEAFDAAEATLGPIDSVIANAGGTVEGPALDLDVADFDRVMAVNLRGVFLTVREGARRMIAAGSKERRHGRILIVSSVTAHAVAPGIAPYSASKAAVSQLGRVLAREWANRGVNVNMIAPGYIETDLNADWFASEGGKKQIARWPRRRLMAEDSLDPIVLYLLSDASAEVTGSTFTLDDGQTL